MTIKAKKRQQDLNTIRFEQSVFAFYDVEQLLEEERDKGKDYITISDFLKDINSGIIKKYGGIEEFVNGKHDITWKDESINAVKYIIFCKGVGVHSPQYLPSQPLPSNDRRRTLYWNPNIETDENGEATIHCFNASKSTFLTISAETIHDGQPASLNIHSIGLDESKTDHLQ